jgi:hypothetical protein
MVKNRRITFMASEEEFNQIKLFASVSHMSISQYCRWRALQNPSIWDEEILKKVSEWKRQNTK